MNKPRSWSARVRERDGNTCVICGAGGVVHAHHIMSRVYHHELANKVDNGVTLCPACHLLAHRGTFSPVGFGKLSEADGIRALEERAQSAALRPLIVRIIEGDVEHTRQAIEFHRDEYRYTRCGWNVPD